MRRRAAVGPVIGHLKTVCRNYLEGRDADRINAALPSPAKTSAYSCAVSSSCAPCSWLYVTPSRPLRVKTAIWPGPGSEDTELGVLMEPEVVMERRKFTREFKLEAARLITERGVSYVQAAEDLGVHQSQLRSCGARWPS